MIMKITLLALSLLLPLVAQERVDQTTDAKMRSEELEHSQIMHTLHMLTDRYGPRVTGTPNHELAAKWAAAEMARWGLKNTHLEPWEFGHPGWLNETASGHIDVLTTKTRIHSASTCQACTACANVWQHGSHPKRNPH